MHPPPCLAPSTHNQPAACPPVGVGHEPEARNLHATEQRVGDAAAGGGQQVAQGQRQRARRLGRAGIAPGHLPTTVSAVEAFKPEAPEWAAGRWARGEAGRACLPHTGGGGGSRAGHSRIRGGQAAHCAVDEHAAVVAHSAAHLRRRKGSRGDQISMPRQLRLTGHQSRLQLRRNVPKTEQAARAKALAAQGSTISGSTACRRCATAP